MRKTALLLTILFAATFLFSCGKKEVKLASQESKTAEESFALAEKIRDAFIKNDRDMIQKNTTESGYKDVTANKKSYESVELAFTPRWVEIEKDKVMLNVTWKGIWTSGEKKTEDRGMAVFVMEGKPLKLSGILRTNPFTFPVQQQPRPY
jgi:hypothetical protein